MNTYPFQLKGSVSPVATLGEFTQFLFCMYLVYSCLLGELHLPLSSIIYPPVYYALFKGTLLLLLVSIILDFICKIQNRGQRTKVS
jgi:hypothetical protein